MPYKFATQAQVAFIKSLGGQGLNPGLSTTEAVLIANNLVYSRAGRGVGEPRKQGRIPRDEV
jgi:hypothetical protein